MRRLHRRSHPIWVRLICAVGNSKDLRGTFSFEKRTFAHRRADAIPGPIRAANRGTSAHRWAIPVPRRFASANRGPASNPTRLFCRWQRFAGFLETGSLHPPPAAHCLFPHTP